MLATIDARLVSLADVVAHAPEGQEPAPAFVADLRGEDVEVTAVLERTAVIASLRDRWAEKRTARLTDLLVEPKTIQWRPKLAPRDAFIPRRQGPYSPVEMEARREASDRRARTEQAQRAAAARTDRQASRPGVQTRPEGSGWSRSGGPVVELAAARQRIAELEAELERHRNVVRNVLHDIRHVLRSAS